MSLFPFHRWGNWGSERCHKAEEWWSQDLNLNLLFQNSCAVFALHEAFPNQAAHQTHWGSSRSYLWPIQISAVGPEICKQWFWEFPGSPVVGTPRNDSGNSLAVQWLELRAFTAEGPGSIPSWGTGIPQAMWCGQKNQKKTMTCVVIWLLSPLLDESSMKAEAMSVLCSDTEWGQHSICCVTEYAGFPALTHRPAVKSFYTVCGKFSGAVLKL